MKEFLVAYVGVVVPWEEASPALRRIALDAIVQIAYWKQRFEEATKARKYGDVIAVDTRQKRADALTRAEQTHKRLLPKVRKQASANVTPHEVLEETRATTDIDALLDKHGMSKKQKRDTA